VRIHDDYLWLQFLRDSMVAEEAYRDALTNHRRVMSRGAVGEATPALPPALVLTPPITTDPVTPGIWQRNNEDVRRVREAPAYTDETGGLLGIIPIVQEAPTEETTQLSLKVSTALNYHVKVAGNMLGFDALRIDYQRNGSTAWTLAAYITKLPAEFQITPATPGQPEQGRIRGVYIKDNQEFGQYSPEYPITVS
jgi:hypothetical protein